MKKLVAGIAAAVLALSMCSMTVFAAQGTVDPHWYVDNNGDGICDTCGVSSAFVDANGDGICDNYGMHNICVGSHGCGNVNANATGGYYNGGYGGRHCGGYYNGGWHH